MRYLTICALIILADRQLQVLANPFRRQASSTATSTFSPVPTTAVLPATTTSASPPASSDPPSPFPTVTLYPAGVNGPIEVIGRNPTRFYDIFAGVPFAQPPVGKLRFARPQPAVYNSSSVNASQFRPACAQTVYQGHQTYQDLSGRYGTSEDCLYLNIIRPTGGRVGNVTDIPVLVFFPGGNFYGGAATNYDGARFGQIAVDTDMPMIQITAPYRLGVLGWPIGSDAAESGVGNLGVRDAVLALEWVRDNIRAFGGDPAKITAAGQSAGGAIISLLYLRPDLELFRSALIMSASPSLFNLGATADVYDGPYRQFLRATRCQVGSNSTRQAGENSLDCLRRVDLATLLSAQTTVINRYGPSAMFGPTVDGDLVQAAPSSVLASGAFSNKPILIGSVKDEGTAFVLPNITSAGFEPLIQDAPVANRSSALVQAMSQMYPEDPALGAPYGSGNNTFGFQGTFKRAASYYGDAFFQAPRRLFHDQLTYFGVKHVWGYHFEQPMPARLGIPPYIGTGHHSDTIWSYGQILAPLQNFTESDQTLSLQMIRYFVNFIHHSNPNPVNGTDAGSDTASIPGAGFVRPTLPEWRRYADDALLGEPGELLRLVEGNVGMMRDDFRMAQIAYLQAEGRAFGY